MIRISARSALSREEFAAARVARLTAFGPRELEARYDLQRAKYGWNVYGIQGLLDPTGAPIGLIQYVVQISRDGVARSSELGPMPDGGRWQLHPTAFDLLFLLPSGDKKEGRRIALAAPSLDAEPESLGLFEERLDQRGTRCAV